MKQLKEKNYQIINHLIEGVWYYKQICDIVENYVISENNLENFLLSLNYLSNKTEEQKCIDSYKNTLPISKDYIGAKNVPQKLTEEQIEVIKPILYGNKNEKKIQQEPVISNIIEATIKTEEPVVEVIKEKEVQTVNFEISDVEEFGYGLRMFLDFCNITFNTGNIINPMINIISDKEKCKKIANLIKNINNSQLQTINRFITNNMEEISKINSMALDREVIDDIYQSLQTDMSILMYNLMYYKENVKIFEDVIYIINDFKLDGIITDISFMSFIYEIIIDILKKIYITSNNNESQNISNNTETNNESQNTINNEIIIPDKLSEINALRETVISERIIPDINTTNLRLLDWIVNIDILQSKYTNTLELSEIYRALNNELLKALRYCDLIKDMQFSISIVNEEPDTIELQSVVLPSITSSMYRYDGRITIKIRNISVFPESEYSGSSVIDLNNLSI